MRIAEVRAYALTLAHPEPYLGRMPDGGADPDGYQVRPPWRSLYSPRFETLLVRLRGDDGTVGWGEALAPVAPEVPAEIVTRLLRPVLEGAELTGPRPLWYRLRDLMRERGHLVGHQADALAAVDIALWDLTARAAGLPVSVLLGGRVTDRVPTYVSGLPRETDAARAELAAEWAGRGARRIKLHLGHGIAADLATVDAVLAADPRLSVAVDAH
ncbi:MAG: mandelate racemase/muconate lactonizing enzyme family protein, partial [Micromonosporaceae bacterium]